MQQLDREEGIHEGEQSILMSRLIIPLDILLELLVGSSHQDLEVLPL